MQRSRYSLLICLFADEYLLLHWVLPSLVTIKCNDDQLELGIGAAENVHTAYCYQQAEQHPFIALPGGTEISAPGSAEPLGLPSYRESTFGPVPSGQPHLQ
jgi:hypothetical protein